jgi:hypothetical protein
MIVTQWRYPLLSTTPLSFESLNQGAVVGRFRNPPVPDHVPSVIQMGSTRFLPTVKRRWWLSKESHGKEVYQQFPLNQGRDHLPRRSNMDNRMYIFKAICRSRDCVELIRIIPIILSRDGGGAHWFTISGWPHLDHWWKMVGVLGGFGIFRRQPLALNQCPSFSSSSQSTILLIVYKSESKIPCLQHSATSWSALTLSISP